jgi:16S rRNA (guanine(527)-N(7))-methyltransferase RsmG
LPQFLELLRARAPQLTSHQAELLAQHYDLMLRWNRVINLTRIDEIEEAVERHYVESLLVAASLPAGALRIADVGSGAGFPGIPVAVVRPECSVALIESHKRKAVFLKEATRALPNVRVLPMRAEQVAESFNWVISRAVSLGDLHKFGAHLAPWAAVSRETGQSCVSIIELGEGNCGHQPEGRSR